jgi:hypothetical protein
LEVNEDSIKQTRNNGSTTNKLRSKDAMLVDDEHESEEKMSSEIHRDGKN